MYWYVTEKMLHYNFITLKVHVSLFDHRINFIMYNYVSMYYKIFIHTLIFLNIF